MTSRAHSPGSGERPPTRSAIRHAKRGLCPDPYPKLTPVARMLRWASRSTLLLNALRSGERARPGCCVERLAQCSALKDLRRDAEGSLRDAGAPRTNGQLPGPTEAPPGPTDCSPDQRTTPSRKQILRSSATVLPTRNVAEPKRRALLRRVHPKPDRQHAKPETAPAVPLRGKRQLPTCTGIRAIHALQG